MARNRSNDGEVMITNRGRQMIPLQVRPPKGDFYYEEHQVRLCPGRSVTLPKRYLNYAQLENCRSRGDITIREGK
jgi:hypothetical protein